MFLVSRNISLLYWAGLVVTLLLALYMEAPQTAAFIGAGCISLSMLVAFLEFKKVGDESSKLPYKRFFWLGGVSFVALLVLGFAM